MKNKKQNVFKRVVYLDSSIIDEQTHEVAVPVLLEAIGFLVYEDNKSITLARERIGEEWRGQVSIPKCSILKINK